ncbi:MAG: nuclear transport factor 2 family protein [Oscillospiraceae bacterium]
MEYPNYTQDEMNKMLWEMENRRKIEDLMCDYWWYMDSRQWEKWEDVFTEDLHVYFDAIRMADNRAFFCKNNSQLWLKGVRSSHQGHQHRIEFTGPTTATSRYMLNDRLAYPDGMVRDGCGYYFDDYRLCEDGKWRISVIRLGYLLKDYPANACLDKTEIYDDVEIEAPLV